jgi:hypothetical protein
LARAVAVQLIERLHIKVQKPKQPLHAQNRSLLTMNMKAASERFAVGTKVIASRTRTNRIASEV